MHIYRKQRNYAHKTSFINNKYVNSPMLSKNIWEIKTKNKSHQKHDRKKQHPPIKINPKNVNSVWRKNSYNCLHRPTKISK